MQKSHVRYTWLFSYDSAESLRSAYFFSFLQFLQ